MPLQYLDASALVKRYVREVGSVAVDRLMSSGPVAVSSVVQVEVASAVARRAREGSITVLQRDAIVERFADELDGFLVIAVSAPILAAAAELARLASEHAPLRAIDAIHLATAAVVARRYAEAGEGFGAFVTSDRQLRRAAAEIGLPVVDPLQSSQDEAEGGR